MDRAGVAPSQQYADRLKLVAAYDQAGFDMYHLAEHHSTPLGMSPSPSVFLAAVSQQTRRLRFGPLVYPLVLYHPLRLYEEICMLDHMSGGRFEFGVGKGASPHELAIYGVDISNPANPQYAEALTVLMRQFTHDSVDFEGAFYTFRDVPVELKPLQQPAPPMWYGVSRADSAARAARNKYNVVANLPAAAARPVLDAYRDEWLAAGGQAADLPRHGVNRHVVIADTDEQAQAIAGRSYARWIESFWMLWDKRGQRPPYSIYPETFAEAQKLGYGVAGTAERVLDTLAAQTAQAGGNYLVCRFAFGDMALSETMRSVELFQRTVMPGLTAARAAAE